jgi:hypothetical protein
LEVEGGVFEGMGEGGIGKGKVKRENEGRGGK